MRPQAIAQAAVLACGTSAGAPPHPGGPAQSDRSLQVHCSRQTPFSARLPALAGPGVAATGRGMDQVSAVLPTGGAAARVSVSVHVDY